MADGSHDPTAELASIRTKLGSIEKDVQTLENKSIDDRYFQSELGNIRGEINNVRIRLEAINEKVEAQASEELQKRLLVYGAILTAVASIIVTLLMG